MIVLILKLLIVLLFLIMFLRRPSVTWGVGLLTVTSAMLLDTFLGTFNREDMLTQLGFFYYVIAGGLFAGTAFWLWGVLRPYLPANGAKAAASVRAEPMVTTAVASATVPVIARAIPSASSLPENSDVTADAYAAAGYDRQMLYDQIHERFGPEDLADLVFDLELNELDVMPPGAGLETTTTNILDAANREEKVAALALAIERILTPPPADHLPRLDKLSVDSPRPVLRYYLLANNNVTQMHELATGLDIDWEQLPQSSKRGLARELLRYVDRRGRLGDLLSEMRRMATAESS